MITIIILSIILAVSIFVNYNQLRKQEAQADYIEDLENSNLEHYSFNDQLRTKIKDVNSRLRQIDRLGSFEADDETGFIFQEMKDIIDQLTKGVE